MGKDKSQDLRGGLEELLGNIPTRTNKIEILDIQDKELRDALIVKKQQPKRGRPRKGESDSNYIRITTIVDAEKWEKIKQISHDAGLTFKEVMDAVLDIAIDAYESKNGVIVAEKKQSKTDASSLFK